MFWQAMVIYAVTLLAWVGITLYLIGLNEDDDGR